MTCPRCKGRAIDLACFGCIPIGERITATEHRKRERLRRLLEQAAAKRKANP